jgi:hypothetical protein
VHQDGHLHVCGGHLGIEAPFSGWGAVGNSAEGRFGAAQPQQGGGWATKIQRNADASIAA